VVVAFVVDEETGWRARHPAEVREFVPVRGSAKTEASPCDEGRAIDEAEVEGLPSSVAVAAAVDSLREERKHHSRKASAVAEGLLAGEIDSRPTGQTLGVAE
jgi:hypothetical protein